MSDTPLCLSCLNSLYDCVLLTPTPPHGSRTNMGVIEPGDQKINIKILIGY